MGCVASKPDINDHHHNIFQVVNVDDLGHRFTAAKLEVTDGELILHQRGKTATRWPLRCLRRYGFDAELFSFESGRRCPTGPGIYAFKCRRAEALFNLLQLQIQNITEDAAGPPQDMSEEARAALGDPAIRPILGEPRPTLGSSVGATDLEGYLEPMPRPPSVRHNSLVSAVSVTSNSVPARLQGSNSVPPRVAGGTGVGMEALNVSINTMGVCVGSRYNGGGIGYPGSVGYRSGGYGGGYNTGERNNSLSYQPSIDRGHNNNSFLFSPLVADASDSGDGGSVVGGGGGGGRASGGGIARLPASPPAPLSPLPVTTFYDERSDDTPPTPGRDPPSTPTDPIRGLCMNHVTRIVSYDTHAVPIRPFSFPSCHSTMLTQLNHGRRPRTYVNSKCTHYDTKMTSYDSSRGDNLYVNVEPERSHERSHVYVNLAQDKVEGPAVPPRPSLTLPSSGSGAGVADDGGCCGSGSSNSGTNTTDTDHHNSQLNYVVIELEVNSDSSAVPPQSPPGSVTSGLESPNRMTEGYAQIDFIKTAAISSCTGTSVPALDDGFRKTRHNSTFTNPVILTRHNSSLSD